MRARRSITVVLAALGALLLLAGALLGAAWWFVASDAGLRWAVGEARSRTGGKLTLEGTQGTLAGTVRIERLSYDDEDLRLVADKVELSWSPRALLSRSVIVDTLGAEEVTLELKTSGGAYAPPASLALPWPLEVRRAAIERVDVASGANRWRFARLAFHYSGSERRHALDELAFDSEWGALRGNLAVEANRPFAATGALAFAGSETLKRGSASVTVGGDLSTLTLAGDASAAQARAKGAARISPFDPSWLRGFEVQLADVDLARFDARLPRTSLSATIDGAGETERRIRGRIAARNAQAGPVSADRLPLAAFSSSFLIDAADTVTFEAIEAAVGGAGRVAGTVRVDEENARWDLAVKDLDLHALATDLKPTRLAGAVKGTLRLDAREANGTLGGELKQAGVALAFDATIRGGVIDLRTFRARAQGGTLQGSATLAIGGTQAFAVSAVAVRLDPAAFGDYPQASLSGMLDARGELKPAWSAALLLKLADGSRLRGLPLSGRGRLTLSRERASDADVDIGVASNRLKLAGSFGRPGDLLGFSLDAPNLAAIDPRLGGRARASGRIGGSWERPSLALAGSGESLHLGANYAVTTLTADIEIGAADVAPGDRPLKLDVAASGVRADALALRAASVKVTGTLARHDAAITATALLPDGDFNASARLVGGWSGNAATGSWSGQIVALDGGGAYALALAQPGALEVRAGRVHATGVRGTLAGGHFALHDLLWDAGRLSSSGEFSALPAAPLLGLTDSGAPLVSSLTFSGRWSFAATPRVNGTLSASRDGGDLAPADAPELALGLTRLELNAESTDDRVHATLVARSRFGTADLVVDAGPSPQAPGRFDKTTPLTLSAHVDAASLRALQSLAGTTAIVDGHVKLDLAGHGTLERVRLSGSIDGDALKIEAPQYGVYLKEGVVRARLADDAITVSELSFTAGSGRFVASGVIPAAGEGDVAGSRLTWKADKVALFNRPDTQLTLSGAGTLAPQRKSVTLAGALRADEGYFEFRPVRREVLGDDVVVRGRERKQSQASVQRVPFAVDLDLDFGDRLIFVGEGFDTGLAGKVHVQTTGERELVAKGTISAVRGTYTAFGQRLAIERGELYFDGPLDNPGLDVLALRKNLAVEAGVEVTGTVRVPRVQLTSDPPVPDNEKLSWLVLGHGLESTTSADAAALQAALAALGGVGGAPVGQRIARTFGVDDISMRAADSTRTGAAGQVVAFTKRLTDKLSLVYEQGLSVANNALKMEYALSRTITIRAEAGFVSGFGIYYSRSFD